MYENATIHPNASYQVLSPPTVILDALASTNSVCVAGVVGVVADFPVKEHAHSVRRDGERKDDATLILMGGTFGEGTIPHDEICT